MEEKELRWYSLGRIAKAVRILLVGHDVLVERPAAIRGDLGLAAKFNRERRREIRGAIRGHASRLQAMEARISGLEKAIPTLREEISGGLKTLVNGVITTMDRLSNDSHSRLTLLEQQVAELEAKLKVSSCQHEMQFYIKWEATNPEGPKFQFRCPKCGLSTVKLFHQLSAEERQALITLGILDAE